MSNQKWPCVCVDAHWAQCHALVGPSGGLAPVDTWVFRGLGQGETWRGKQSVRTCRTGEGQSEGFSASLVTRLFHS